MARPHSSRKTPSYKKARLKSGSTASSLREAAMARISRTVSSASARAVSISARVGGGAGGVTTAGGGGAFGLFVPGGTHGGGIDLSASSCAAASRSTACSAAAQSSVSGSCGGGRLARGCPFTRGGGVHAGSGWRIHIGSPLFQLGTCAHIARNSLRNVSGLVCFGFASFATSAG